MDTQMIKNLFSQVSAINKKYEKIAEITGENFNIFKILKIESEEVLTHSRFLCELLNPKGSHGKGNLFLKLFIESNIDLIEENKTFVSKLKEFNLENCTVKSEAHIGFKNSEQTEGGRIDVLVKENNSNKAIIIENKIYAGDQFQQLVRYNNAHKEAPIFYLTLYGSSPSKESAGGLILGNNFKCISYETDILEWLTSCRKEAVENPILREGITQYINLIKHLTGQTMNDNMKKEIVKTILDGDGNLELAFDISKSLNDVKIKLRNDFKEQIQKNDVKPGLEFSESPNGLMLHLTPSKWKNHTITFFYESNNLEYGIRRNIEANEITRYDEIDNFENNGRKLGDNFKGSRWFSMYTVLYPNFENNIEFYNDIRNGEAKKKAMEFVELINKHFNNEKY